jgi:hypothetical protein
MSKDLASTPFVETRFNGSLWHKSPFKGPPSSKSIEAWDSVKEYGIISATEEDLVLINRSHSLKTASKFPEVAGGGYVAMTMGTHQLHCLFWLWRDHHRPYFPEMLKNKEAIPEMYERHFEHCIDFIRQSIMCNFDMGLLTFDWVLDHPNPVPNTNSMHKCVDWGAADTWMKNRAVEVPEGFQWSQPEGQETLPWNP